MNLTTTGAAAHGRVASAAPRAAPAPALKGRRHGTATRTAIAAKHATRRQAADPGAKGETAATSASSSSSSSSSVSRRAALALSLASAASGLMLPKAASSAIVDPSAVGGNSVDPLLEGGTVTLLKVRGDGRDRLSLSEAVVLDTNRKVHAANGAPVDFPGFVRVGFDIKVVVPIEDEEEEEANAPEKGEATGGEGEGGAAAAAVAAAAAATASAADETSTSSSPPPPTRDDDDDASSPSSSTPRPSLPPVLPLLKRGYQITPEGLIYKDYVIGDEGADPPRDGQEVVFDYTAFNEAGARIDSSFSKGRPAQARIGVGAGGGLIPGFELGLLGMRPGGRRRLIVPPALGPPIGPQTFFSAKQCEVFDVQLRAVKSCRRRQVAMFSDVVCE